MTYLNNLRIENSKQFSIVQVIPGTVVGPSEFATTAAQAFAHMDRHSRALLFDEFKHKYAFGFVHVNDCAKVHIEALDEQKVKSEDVPPWFIAAGSSDDGCDGEMLWSKAADMVEREFSREVEEGVFKLGRGRTPINMPYRVDATLTENMLLGSERIRGLEDCIRDIAQWYVELKTRDTESSQNA
jgi:nucleoside-diphosphate-sugar epimerase